MAQGKQGQGVCFFHLVVWAGSKRSGKRCGRLYGSALALPSTDVRELLGECFVQWHIKVQFTCGMTSGAMSGHLVGLGHSEEQRRSGATFYTGHCIVFFVIYLRHII